MKNYFYVILLGLLIFSCQKDIEENNSTLSTEIPSRDELTKSGGKEIILGEKIENPYSVKNMKKAYENILNSQSKISSMNGAKTATETIEISTNHHYVKFWCTNSKDEEKLDSLDIKYSKFPLDREIIEEGDFYVEENKSESDEIEGYWVYTSLYVDFNIESLNLKYEI